MRLELVARLLMAVPVSEAYSHVGRPNYPGNGGRPGAIPVNNEGTCSQCCHRDPEYVQQSELDEDGVLTQEFFARCMNPDKKNNKSMLFRRLKKFRGRSVRASALTRTGPAEESQFLAEKYDAQVTWMRETSMIHQLKISKTNRVRHPADWYNGSLQEE